MNDRSFAFMDDNVPKELTFEGPPKLIFIEGLVSAFFFFFKFILKLLLTHCF